MGFHISGAHGGVWYPVDTPQGRAPGAKGAVPGPKRPSLGQQLCPLGALSSCVRYFSYLSPQFFVWNPNNI